jgi:hypothetical protein
VAILFSDVECCPVTPEGAAADSTAAGNTAETSGSSQSMAVSVTRHAQTPPVDEFQFLLSGIDTLDLGLYVIWGSDWKRRLRSLDQKKQKARKQKDGLLVGLPSGRNTAGERAQSAGERQNRTGGDSMSKSVSIDTGEFDQAMEDARYISGLLGIMEAALATDQGRATLNDNIEFVSMDATRRMNRVVEFLEKYS